MKKLALIGILVSLLGIMLSFAVINNHTDFYIKLHNALGMSFEDLEVETPERKIYDTTDILNFGTNICFVLMGLFFYQLFICIRLYRSETY